MIRITSRIALALALTGCAARPIVDQLPPPIEAGCADVCYVPCDASGIDFAPGQADPVGDLVEQVIIPLRMRIDRCELSRLACQQCVDRLKQAGVIR